MVEKDWVFVLGAQDPEMREIERILRRGGRSFVHAAPAGERCNARTAYAAKAGRYRQLLAGGGIKEMHKGASVSHVERFLDADPVAGRRGYGNPYRGYAGA